MQRMPGMMLIGIAVLIGCKKDKEDPTTPEPPVNEEEVITDLQVHFHSAGGAEHKHFHFSDSDGPGGAAPVIEADTLSADSVYEVHLTLLNSTVTPADDITVEIVEEAEEHQFFYHVTGASTQVDYTDADANGHPIGLGTTWSAGTAAVGSIVITLRHGPDKGAAGVSDGDITNAGGETDIEVQFPLVME
jgi:hypothetical protein